MRWQTGIDLGGTKISQVLLDDQGQTVEYRRIMTPQGDYQATVTAIAEMHAAMEAQAGSKLPLGIGVPGSVSPQTGLMRNSNSVCLNGQDLLGDLRNATGRDVALANDANCLALSESTDGAADGASSVFAVILGTGVGGGIVVGGQLLNGCNGIAGEWGHNPLIPESDILAPVSCYCGNVGCVETWLSGPALSRHYQILSGRVSEALPLPPTEIAALAEQGDQVAQQVLENFLANLADALSVVINVVDPDVIVFGGGLSNLEAIYRDLPERLAAQVFSDGCSTRIVAAKWGDDSGVRGAARLPRQVLGQRRE